MDANYQVQGISPLWYRIVTGILVTATFVVFFIIVWPFISSYYKYYQNGASGSQETFNVIKLPDVANISNNQNAAPPNTKQTDEIAFDIETPDLKISAPIVNGVSQEDLYHGVGHHPGTPWPKDEKGNVIITGHSSWIDPANSYGFVFKNLNRLKIGDDIQIRYPSKVYKYKVTGKFLIDPQDTSLFMQNVKVPTLTVYTCSPVYTNWKRLVYVSEMQE
jgi:LPXTG-site transpeptidase (sortase) family protein